MKDTTRTLFQNWFDFYTVKWTMINMPIVFKNWACKQENIFCSRLNLGQDFWEKIILKNFYVSRINEEKHCKKIFEGGFRIQNSEAFWHSEFQKHTKHLSMHKLHLFITTYYFQFFYMIWIYALGILFDNWSCSVFLSTWSRDLFWSLNFSLSFCHIYYAQMSFVRLV